MAFCFASFSSQHFKVFSPWFLRLGVILILSMSWPLLVQAEQLPITTFTTTNGLAQDRVKKIVRDSRGYLWFCTADGLSRFDGYSFTTYGTDQGLPHQSMNDLLEAQDGIYWVATNGGGVGRFDPAVKSEFVFGSGVTRSQQLTRQLFVSIPVGDESPTNRVNVVFQSQDGRIWAGSDKGLFVLVETPATRTFQLVDLRPDLPATAFLQIWAIVEDTDGSLWIGTSHGLTRLFQDGHIIVYQLPPPAADVVVWSVLKDRDGRIWVGSNRGVSVIIPPAESAMGSPTRLSIKPVTPLTLSSQTKNFILPATQPNGLTFAKENGLPDSVVRSLFQASDGTIWIGTRTGAAMFCTGQLQQCVGAAPITNQLILTLAEDSAHNLWLGTETSGAFRIAHDGFSAFTKDDGLEDPEIRTVLLDPAGRVVGIGNGMLQVLTGQRFTTVRPLMPADENKDGKTRYRAFLLDHTGVWWAATTKALYRFPKVDTTESLAAARPTKICSTDDGLALPSLLKLVEDQDGNLWILMTGQQPLARWERATEKLHIFSEFDGVPAYSTPSALCQDKAGNIWVGLRENGLMRYRQGQFERFTRNDGVPGFEIRSLYLDESGRLWIGSTAEGAARIDHPEHLRPVAIRYTTRQGLTSDIVRSISADLHGDIYLGTARGVDRLDPHTNRISHYTIADGLNGSEIEASVCDRDGAIWFATRTGLSRYRPPSNTAPAVAQVSITGLKISGKPKSLLEFGETEVSNLNLDSDQNNVQIEFSGLSFAVGDDGLFQYRLDDTDDDWSPPTRQRSVTLANLSPGSYRFEVRAVSASNRLSSQPAVIQFVIQPPLWQRWWFLLLLASIPALVAYGVHSYRLAQVLERERLRMRIAADLHDEVGAHLSQVAILSEVIRQKAGGMGDQVDDLLSRMARNSIEAVNTMSDIVWAINPQKDRRKDLVRRMRQLAGELLSASDIRFRLEATESGAEKKMPPDTRRQIYLIFKESLNNIVRHASCTEVQIEFRVQASQIVLQVTDNGKGFEQRLAGDGNGLTNMRRRAESLGGELIIETSPNQGTTVRLTAQLLPKNEPGKVRKWLSKYLPITSNRLNPNQSEWP